jgi:hypothetical protein
VEIEPVLLEGGDSALTSEYSEVLDGTGVVACIHGDVIPGILGVLLARGVSVPRDAAWPTGDLGARPRRRRRRRLAYPAPPPGSWASGRGDIAAIPFLASTPRKEDAR